MDKQRLSPFDWVLVTISVPGALEKSLLRPLTCGFSKVLIPATLALTAAQGVRAIEVFRGERFDVPGWTITDPITRSGCEFAAGLAFRWEDDEYAASQMTERELRYLRGYAGTGEKMRDALGKYDHLRTQHSIQRNCG
ncbi:MAG: hypothetical protein AB7G06_07265 [Bdellovibrionales bacterium]